MRRLFLVTGIVFLVSSLLVPNALANHTNPREPLSPTDDPGTGQLLPSGEGTWELIRNFPPNPGTDLKFFRKKGRLYAISGTLGQADEASVGQRIIQLVNRKGKVVPKWVADHGSANCPTEDPSATTSLQHDQIVTPKKGPKLFIDTTDAGGRCHDPEGGGLEIVDISKIHRKKFKPREIHLTRHAGTSHTVTRDATRPWIVYNNASQSAGMPWIDVLDIRSCMKKRLTTTKSKRRSCRPKVFRIYLQPEWSQRIDANGDRIEGTESSCHDIEARRGRIYCANLNSTVVLDVSGLTNSKGAIKGTPLNCEIVPGTNTKAKVTDCSNPDATGGGQATGWDYIGHVNHPGRNGSHNTNTEYESTEGVAVSHEAEPTRDKKWMFVTDERGGGVVPGGASCGETPNPYGNGGVHVFDIAGGGEFEYAQDPDGNKAVFIGAAVVPSPTFCTAHVMQQIRGEQRFAIAWYTQGTKIVDWFVDGQGRWTFRETSSVVPQNPSANTWVSQVFKRVKNDDGTKTYYFMTSDITRGIDIMSWTGPTNPNGTPPPADLPSRRSADPGAAVPAAFLLPLLFAAGRRRSHAVA
ncbi:MAG TPA: hypothetical protein VFS18_01785 [Actinomycetota bacterium]|nr:hypothetical protein [Actinomycetota bacterium]